MRRRGTVRSDHRTKELIPRLAPGDIAVIDHPDLDQVAARDLLTARVGAVVNASPSITGRYPNPGPALLLQAGVPLLDQVGRGVLTVVREGDTAELVGDTLYRGDGRPLAQGRLLDLEEVARCQSAARDNLGREVDRFIHNTLAYVRREKAFILRGLELPPLQVPMAGRHVLVVVRGPGYREDLRAVRAYIREEAPVLVGVDGGADALLEAGLPLDVVVGDMDSVSDRALRAAGEIVVHAYPDGRAPGLARVRALDLEARVVPAPGTSEDLGLLLPYEAGAALVVAVGTHSHLIDFLEKGRPGMASTFLTRLKVGEVLVDAKGVSRLYRGRPGIRQPLQIGLAAAVPIGLILALSGPLRELLRLLWLQVRIWAGW